MKKDSSPFAEQPDAVANPTFYSDMKAAIAGKDNNFFGHSNVSKQSIVKNPPPQPSQLGKDGFYSNVQNRTGKL